MRNRACAAAVAAAISVFGTISEAATVGVAVAGDGFSAPVGLMENRPALGANAIKYYIPLEGSDCTYGVGSCGTVHDHGAGSPTLSMWMLFDGVSTTNASQLSVYFEDLDLIGANDPDWFWETVQLSWPSESTPLIDDIAQIIPNGTLSGGKITQQLLTVNLGVLPSEQFWLKFDFTAKSDYWAGNTPEYLIASVATVPLPAAGWLFLSAIGGLGAVGRARKRKRQAA